MHCKLQRAEKANLQRFCWQSHVCNFKGFYRLGTLECTAGRCSQRTLWDLYTLHFAQDNWGRKICIGRGSIRIWKASYLAAATVEGGWDTHFDIV